MSKIFLPSLLLHLRIHRKQNMAEDRDASNTSLRRGSSDCFSRAEASQSEDDSSSLFQDVLSERYENMHERDESRNFSDAQGWENNDEDSLCPPPVVARMHNYDDLGLFPTMNPPTTFEAIVQPHKLALEKRTKGTKTHEGKDYSKQPCIVDEKKDVFAFNLVTPPRVIPQRQLLSPPPLQRLTKRESPTSILEIKTANSLPLGDNSNDLPFFPSPSSFGNNTNEKYTIVPSTKPFKDETKTYDLPYFPFDDDHHDNHTYNYDHRTLTTVCSSRSGLTSGFDNSIVDGIFRDSWDEEGLEISPAIIGPVDNVYLTDLQTTISQASEFIVEEGSDDSVEDNQQTLEELKEKYTDQTKAIAFVDSSKILLRPRFSRTQESNYTLTRDEIDELQILRQHAMIDDDIDDDDVGSIEQEYNAPRLVQKPIYQSNNDAMLKTEKLLQEQRAYRDALHQANEAIKNFEKSHIETLDAESMKTRNSLYARKMYIESAQQSYLATITGSSSEPVQEEGEEEQGCIFLPISLLMD